MILDWNEAELPTGVAQDATGVEVSQFATRIDTDTGEVEMLPPDPLRPDMPLIIVEDDEVVKIRRKYVPPITVWFNT